MKWYYEIKDLQGEVIHQSKKGLTEKGFDDASKAQYDAEIIRDMKFVGETVFIHLFQEEEKKDPYNPVTEAARKAALKAYPVEQGEVTGGPFKVSLRAAYEAGYEEGYSASVLMRDKNRI